MLLLPAAAAAGFCSLQHFKSSLAAACLCGRSGYNVGVSACEVPGCNGRVIQPAKTFRLSEVQHDVHYDSAMCGWSEPGGFHGFYNQN